MQRDENAVDALWAAGLYYVLFRNRVNIRLAYHKGEKEREHERLLQSHQGLLPNRHVKF